MIQAKTIAMLFLIVIAVVGATAIWIRTVIQSAQAGGCPPHCIGGDTDDSHGQSSHDVNGDTNSNGHA